MLKDYHWVWHVWTQFFFLNSSLSFIFFTQFKIISKCKKKLCSKILSATKYDLWWWVEGQFMILPDKRGRGGLQTPIFCWHHICEQSLTYPNCQFFLLYFLNWAGYQAHLYFCNSGWCTSLARTPWCTSASTSRGFTVTSISTGIRSTPRNAK